MPSIHPFSGIPLYLEAIFQGTRIGIGTGFIMNHGDAYYIITNGHMVTGRDPDTGQAIDSITAAADPDILRVWHHSKTLGRWLPRNVPLRRSESGEPTWKQHPRGLSVDVVALPFAVDQDICIYQLDLSLRDIDIIVNPSDPVSVVGFPYGLRIGIAGEDGGFPVWKTGHVASDIDLDYNGKPAFLIDVTTKSGMSGSPVVAIRSGGFHTSTAFQIGGEATRLLGVYSGRIRDADGNDVRDFNLGLVWKPSVIEEVLKT